MDRAFRTSGQVESVLHTACIAMLPKVDHSRPKKFLEAARTSGPHTIVPNSDMRAVWTALDSPFSRYSEALRSIKLSLNERLDSSKVVGFTSSVPGEGKSTVAASLSVLAAREGARVILVDCDLRTASLSRHITAGVAGGIVDVITGKVPLKDAIWKEPYTNLAFLPADIKSRSTGSAEVLASAAAKELFNQLRQTYEFIIVDLPPLAPVVDVRATAPFVDLYTLVIEWGRTKIDLVEHALAEARVVYENLHGVVLNKVDINLLTSYEGNRGKFYQNKQYISYGFTD